MTRSQSPLRSIRTQLMLWNILSLSVLMAVLGVVIHYMVQTTITRLLDQELEHRTRHMVDFPPLGRDAPPDRSSLPPFADRPNHDRPDHDDPHDHRFDGQDHIPPDERFRFAGSRPIRGNDPGTDYRPLRFDKNGKSLEHDRTRPIWDADGFALAQRGQTVYRTTPVNGELMRVLSRPFPMRGAVMGVVQAPYPLTEVNAAIALVNSALLFLSPVALLFAGLGGALLTERVLGRVRQLDWVASRISARDFGERLPVIGNDEFAALATTFNGLLGRLEAAFREQTRLMEQQRRFTADASHELKTPLTIIKGTASMALAGDQPVAFYQQSLGEIRGAAEMMARLVQDLLLLAQSDGGQLGQGRIELLMREVIERAIAGVPRNPEVPIVLCFADDSLTVCGSEMELIRLFRNLLDNAARYTPAGSITVEAAAERNFVRVTVTDTGIGIAPEHMPHLGERFYRVDDSRSRPDGGTGLGLSISTGIAQAHGGSIEFASVVGKGTIVTVRLPIAADSRS